MTTESTTRSPTFDAFPGHFEADLAKLAARGNRAAYVALFDRYFDDVYTFAAVTLGFQEDAEDAVEEVFFGVQAELDSGWYNHRNQFNVVLFRYAFEITREIYEQRNEAGEDELPGTRIVDGALELFESLPIEDRQVAALKYRAGVDDWSATQVLEISRKEHAKILAGIRDRLPPRENPI